MGEKSTQSNGMKRRTYLRTVGAVGLTLGSAQTVGAEHTNDDTVELVLTRTSEGPAKTREVPAAWHNQVRTAKARAKDLEQKLLSNPGVASVGVGVGESSIGGLREKVIKVGLTGTSTRASIPEQVDGVSVEVETNEGRNYQCYEGSYSPLRGGISIESGSGATGSICCRCWANGWRIFTVRHIFTDTGLPCGSIPDDGAYRNGTRIGTIKGSSVEHDAIWIQTNDNFTMSDGIVDESEDIAGWVTESGLDTYSSDGTTMHKRGITTCKETYTIDSYNKTYDNGCGTIHQDLVDYNGNSDPGDSGGTIYLKGDSDGKAWLTSPLSGELDSNIDVFGSAAYAIKNQDAVQDFD